LPIFDLKIEVRKFQQKSPSLAPTPNLGVGAGQFLFIAKKAVFILSFY